VPPTELGDLTARVLRFFENAELLLDGQATTLGGLGMASLLSGVRV